MGSREASWPSKDYLGRVPWPTGLNSFGKAVRLMSLNENIGGSGVGTVTWSRTIISVVLRVEKCLASV